MGTCSTRRVAIVVGGADRPGVALAAALARAGRSIAVVGATGRERAVAEQIVAHGDIAVGITVDLQDRAATHAAFAAAAAALGVVDLVVHAHVAADALDPCLIDALDELGWARCCDGTVTPTLVAFQAAHRILVGQVPGGDAPDDKAGARGGALILVCPSTSVSGAAGLVSLCTAVEAQRLLARSAAQRWRDVGISVNAVLVPVERFGAVRTVAAGPGVSAEIGIDSGLDADLDADLASLVTYLGGNGIGHLHGAMLSLDPGVVTS